MDEGFCPPSTRGWPQAGGIAGAVREPPYQEIPEGEDACATIMTQPSEPLREPEGWHRRTPYQEFIRGACTKTMLAPSRVRGLSALEEGLGEGESSPQNRFANLKAGTRRTAPTRE